MTRRQSHHISVTCCAQSGVRASPLCPCRGPHPSEHRKGGDQDRTCLRGSGQRGCPRKALSTSATDGSRQGSHRSCSRHCPHAPPAGYKLCKHRARLGCSWSLTGWTCLEQVVDKGTNAHLGQGSRKERWQGQAPQPPALLPLSSALGSSSLLAKLHLASLLCRYFNYADMFLDSFKYVYYLLIRP